MLKESPTNERVAHMINTAPATFQLPVLYLGKNVFPNSTQCIDQVFIVVTKYLTHTTQWGRILAHSYRSFSQWLTGSIALDPQQGKNMIVEGNVGGLCSLYGSQESREKKSLREYILQEHTQQRPTLSNKIPLASSLFSYEFMNKLTHRQDFTPSQSNCISRCPLIQIK